MKKILTLYDMNVYKIKPKNFVYKEAKIELNYYRITSDNLSRITALRNHTRRKEFERLLKENKSYGIAAEYQGEIVAYGWVKFSGSFDKFFTIDKGKAYLSSFFVKKDWRGYSIYQSLISYLINKTLKEYDISDIYISIDKENKASIKGASKLGFEKIYEKKLYRFLKMTISKGEI